MSYERDLQATQANQYNPHAANDAQIRYERMTPAERAEHDAKKRAAIAALAADAQAEQQARRDALAAARAADDQQRQAAKEAAERERALAMWGGTREAFDRQWPGMWETMQAQQTVERMERAQQAQWNLARAAF